MTDLAEGADQQDLETPDRVMRRFGVEVLGVDPRAATAVMSMPMAGMRNPFTDHGTVAALAILIDMAGGMANHVRRGPDEWTVSSELAIELSPEGASCALEAADSLVIAEARPLGSSGSSALSVCTFTCDGIVIGGGTVRSYFISGDRIVVADPPETVARKPNTALAELMGVQIAAAAEGMRVLRQLDDPILRNGIGTMHGGVAAAALEMTASALMNTDGAAFHTASVRANFLRPFYASDHSRYVATPLRLGRGAAVSDSQAIGADGRVALTARVTAYR
ncbi:PaaI family thioesterase [Mycobacterium sp. UM_CSW]|uniref:PaaI family thioesterase n=1 Tax=Mycobacterium sp. UM_CSW TaxID=1370119 RepID=UPI00082D4BFA|nr:PaaI family thioesterase [Mycobacterium sp. UM_CSW]